MPNDLSRVVLYVNITLPTTWAKSTIVNHNNKIPTAVAVLQYLTQSQFHGKLSHPSLRGQ